jgi:molybdopterin synthase sulfur carrier subunit
MKIHIRYFASIREIVGQGEEALDVAEGSSVAIVRAELLARYPGLQAIMARCISAANRKYVDAETMLHDGDELVFIPPMGGGSQCEEVR